MDDARANAAPTNGSEPASEIGLDGRVRAALDAVESLPVRNEKGQFVRGILQGGEHSLELRRALEPAKREIAERVRRQLAVDEDDGRETLIGTIDAYAEARVMRQGSFMRISSLDGPVSNKGRLRALVTAWGSFFDREMRAAEKLGLERLSRRVKSTSTRDWLNTEPDRQTDRHDNDPTDAHDSTDITDSAHERGSVDEPEA